ncbi:MAG: choline-sulfatase [Alphaproteobacteria bacterium]|nr:choline-sulfatase [Alphaproteobacteria bacterium]
MAKAKTPNILLIMADQLAPQALPVHGHPMVKAPNLMRLAEDGVVFDNAYCNFPLCVPSRMSMLAGRLAHNIGSWDNATELPTATPTMAHYLRNAGYSATLAGKMHFIGPDQLHGFGERVSTDVYPSNFAWTPDWVKGERYRPTGINMRAVVDAGQCVRSLQIDYDDEVEHAGIQKIHDLARFSNDQPFFLTVSFTHPHSPFVTTRKYCDLYDHDDIDMPAVPAIPVDELDEFSRWLHYAHATDMHTVTEEHIRTARHAYYGMCSYIDDKVGRILDTMDETGMLDDTVVIFSADHGEMLGERGMWYKQCFFEWSVRVPMIVRYPRAFAPRRVTELVSLIDLIPTLRDIAADGSAPEAPSPLDGQSMTGLLSGNAGGWNNTVISEYTGEGVIAPCRMIRRDAHKYIYTHGHPAMLFNTAKDPLELENLAGTPAAAKVETELRAALLDGWDPDHIAAQCIQSQKERLFIQETTGGDPNWAYKFRPDDGNRFVRNDSAVGTKIKARYPFVEPTPFER